MTGQIVNLKKKTKKQVKSIKVVHSGPPGAECRLGASSNMPDFRFCEVQNEQENAAVSSEI